ncbi:hypothetical protein ACFXJ8_29980 [Nonomuraea sp. NPDC059194]|uniref:hypothetical protein n=1 Tax=Nonomuraea sp. NPDC059194 TaxID=3346764 RepID=UPI00368B52F3
MSPMPRRPLLALAYLVPALALAATVVVTRTVSTELVLLNDTLDHPVLFGLAALLLGGLAVRELVRPIPRARVVVVVATIAGMLGWMGYGLRWTLSPSYEVASVKGPGRLSLIVREQHGLFEYSMVLSIREDAGLLSREWSLGCPGFDLAREDLHHVRWVGATRVEARIPMEDEEELVGVDLNASGRPIGTCDYVVSPSSGSE